MAKKRLLLNDPRAEEVTAELGRVQKKLAKAEDLVHTLRREQTQLEDRLAAIRSECTHEWGPNMQVMGTNQQVIRYQRFCGRCGKCQQTDSVAIKWR